MLKLWLPPKVWFQGSQSTITGGRSARNGQTCAIASWFEHSMRCVLITPLGRPVEPEVNRILATVSGPTAALARSTALVGRVARRSAKAVMPGAGRLATISAPRQSSAVAASP